MKTAITHLINLSIFTSKFYVGTGPGMPGCRHHCTLLHALVLASSSHTCTGSTQWAKGVGCGFGYSLPSTCPHGEYFDKNTNCSLPYCITCRYSPDIATPEGKYNRLGCTCCLPQAQFLSCRLDSPPSPLCMIKSKTCSGSHMFNLHYTQEEGTHPKEI